LNARNDFNHFVDHDSTSSLVCVAQQLDLTARSTLEILHDIQNPVTLSSEECIAEKLSKLSLSLYDLGLEEETAEVQALCVVIYRGLIQQHDPQPSYSRSLVLSLERLSTHLFHLGHQEQGLQCAQKAVELCRHVVSQDTFGNKLDLSRSLHNIATRLLDVGHDQEALDAIEEVVQLRMELAEHHPDNCTTDLVESLSTLSDCLSKLSIRDRAQEAALIAVDLLLETVRDDSMSSLVMSLYSVLLT
jgi:hypothetical protein